MTRIETFNFQNKLENYLLTNYINDGNINVNLTPTDIKEALDIELSQVDLDDANTTVKSVIQDSLRLQRSLHHLPIAEQAEKDGEEYGYSTISSVIDEAIKSFDFSNYKDLSVKELNSYILTYDGTNTIQGENLLDDVDERTYIAVYALLQSNEDYINALVQAEELFKHLEK
ncbi:hypothetical protein [Olleya marilimosa]|mgnify:CR=1 FL=1|uniref:hypothetical protein n=1 Tax=Olleya marilimosa TaxID=272164 RepID=UPI0030EDF466|tara:strand:- start:101205 stop:101720 length:516 start_codon:yes stop_codon:yes gene_type:complete